MYLALRYVVLLIVSIVVGVFELDIAILASLLTIPPPGGIVNTVVATLLVLVWNTIPVASVATLIPVYPVLLLNAVTVDVVVMIR